MSSILEAAPRDPMIGISDIHEDVRELTYRFRNF